MCIGIYCIWHVNSFGQVTPYGDINLEQILAYQYLHIYGILLWNVIHAYYILRTRVSTSLKNTVSF